jgi:hypothetical protein
VGWKVALTVQLVPAASDRLQSFVSAKFVLAVMAVMLRAALPEFVTVTESGRLVPPTSSVPKPSVVADKVTIGALFINGSLPPQPENSTSPEKVTARIVFTNAPKPACTECQKFKPKLSLVKGLSPTLLRSINLRNCA